MPANMFKNKKSQHTKNLKPKHRKDDIVILILCYTSDNTLVYRYIHIKIFSFQWYMYFILVRIK